MNSRIAALSIVAILTVGTHVNAACPVHNEASKTSEFHSNRMFHLSCASIVSPESSVIVFHEELALDAGSVVNVPLHPSALNAAPRDFHENFHNDFHNAVNFHALALPFHGTSSLHEMFHDAAASHGAFHSFRSFHEG